MNTLPSPVVAPEIPDLTDEQRAFLADLKAAKKTQARYAVRRLLSLRDTGKHVYRNTVSAKVIERRRKRAKIAKASRRANR